MFSAISSRAGTARCPPSVARQRANVNAACASPVCVPAAPARVPARCGAACALRRVPVTHPSAARLRRDRARAGRVANIGWCACGAPVRVDGFRHRPAYREFFRSGMCQDCQDRVFLSVDSSTGVLHAVRRGIVVGAHGCAVAVFPFLFTSASRPIAWEARHCVLVGPEGSPCDPWGDLEAMADVLVEHQIRVHEADTATDPGVAECVGAPALVLGPDGDVLEACARALPLPSDTPRVPLDEAFAWVEYLGFPLNPLHRFALRAGFTTWREPDAGALRRCAWLAAAFALPMSESDQDESVLDAVLRQSLPSPTETIP